MLLGKLQSVLHSFLSDTQSPLNSLIPVPGMFWGFFLEFWFSTAKPRLLKLSYLRHRFSLRNSENSHFITLLRIREDFYRGKYSWVQFSSFSTAHCVPQASRFSAAYVSQLTFTPWSMAEICHQLPDAAENTLLTSKLGFIMVLLKIESSSMAG